MLPVRSATRIKNNWLASGKNSNDATPYANYNDLVRAKDALYAERVVSVEESLRYSDEAAALVAALKQSIRSGNATEIEMNLDPALFR